MDDHTGQRQPLNEPGHPVGPEMDDTSNPTDAAPRTGRTPHLDPSEDFGGERASRSAAESGEEAWAPENDETDQNQPWYGKQGARGTAGREMLVQLQQMIDTLATQAAPVMREVAAKAAELAAVAGEKAGPLAHKAAGVTEAVGQRVAARSKTMAADLRKPREGGLDVEGDIDASNEWGTDSGEPSTSPDNDSQPRTDQSA